LLSLPYSTRPRSRVVRFFNTAAAALLTYRSGQYGVQAYPV